MMAKQQETEEEWVGGVVSMPVYVNEEGEPYRPDAIFWLGAEGMILSFMLVKPGELRGRVCESLRRAIEHPMFGDPHAPARVRVASSELVEALRAENSEIEPEIEIVRAPTPEFDEVSGQLREMLAREADDDESCYLSHLDPDAVASFFRAAAGFFRARPWDLVPCDECVISVTSESLGLDGAVVSLIGQLGQSLGMLLFASLDEFELYRAAADAFERGEDAALPFTLALSFETAAELPPPLYGEIIEYQWESAAADVYPQLIALDEEMIPRPPTAGEITRAEALALALPQVLSEPAFRAVWSNGEPVTRTLSVTTHAGAIELTLRVPAEPMRPPLRPPGDLLADLVELARDSDEIDPEARARLEDELLFRFSSSPEARSLCCVGQCGLVMDFAASYIGATIATLQPTELSEVVFDILPREAILDPSDAELVIEQNRALYRFLKREFDLEQADACLRVLDGDATERLEEALSDSRNFDRTKAFVMAGREAGYDMSTEEGVDAWALATIGSLPPPASDESPASKRAKARTKKRKRKAARKARKKNR
ncbi:DUF6930 domain-containing protein [Haliangium sp.]|uniref:DUF6930 domain-containing protein n=1 Tax=Haliangium sp. TaxID=2663208 RepID=UPI003D0FB875